MRPLVSDVSQFEIHVRRQLVLNREIPSVYGRHSEFRWKSIEGDREGWSGCVRWPHWMARNTIGGIAKIRYVNEAVAVEMAGGKA